MSGILEGKVGLITGAGSGIGRATSLIFADEGAKVVVSDVHEAGGNKTVALIKKPAAKRYLCTAMSPTLTA